MKNSHIEWCDHTFNPWIGCTKVSPGCANCYAEALDKRWRGGSHWGKGAERVRTSASYWKQPLLWNRRNAEMDAMSRCFCASLADWLDDEVPIEWLADLLALIHATPNLDWLLLTKRPENFENRIGDAWGLLCGTNEPVRMWLGGWARNPPENVWVGTSVEDQQRADERIPKLREIPARVRFLSCEPLLGPIDLAEYFRGIFWPESLRWVICGGESGPNARPMHTDWARSLRNQCQAADVPFFFKQWGEWLPSQDSEFEASDFPDGWRDMPERYCYLRTDGSLGSGYDGTSGEFLKRVGKKHAGRLLDGREWNQFPSTAHLSPCA